MSLILDALNRSRQDVGDAPGLESQHQTNGHSPGASQRWWVLALLVALGVIAFLLYERGGESTPDAPTPEPAIVAEPRAARPQAPAAVPEKQPAPVPVAPEPPARLEKAPVTDAEVAALYAKTSAPAETTAAAEPREKKVEKPASPVSVTQEAVSEQPVDLEAMVSRAQDELENAQLEEHPAPFLASLSQQSKDRIPTIYYERHDYSGKPGQSAVVLNGNTLKRGGRTSAGVRVDEILPDSAVLSYQGTQFRLRALNSWVNL